MSIIKTENLTHLYSQGTPFQQTAIDDINIEIEEDKDKPIIGWDGKTNVPSDTVSNEGDVPMVVAPSENSIGRTLKIVGILTLFVGIFIGLIVGATLSTPMLGYEALTSPSPLRWVYGIAIIISSFISGLVLMGLGEAIILLDKIKVNTSK